MLWIFLQVEIKAFVNDTLSFDSKVLKVIPPDKAKILSNKVILLKPGRAIVITERGKVPIFIREFKKLQLNYDSLVLNVNDSFELKFGNYEYELRPKFIGYIKDNKIYTTSPGIGILIVKSKDAIGRIKVIVKSKNKKQVILSIPNKIIMEKGEKRVFLNYKISTNSENIKISKDTIIALNYGIARVHFSYEDDTTYGYKDALLIVKPRVMEIIGKPGDRIKIEGNKIEILRERGEVKLENNYISCDEKCFGILKIDNIFVPFLFHPDAYKEDEDKDFIIIRRSLEIPRAIEVIRIFPRKKFEMLNNKIIVKERGLGFAVVRTKRGITILKIIGLD
ncbi:MAG: hypothetical protein ABIL45_06885 [candidate division WOR-3 bacterium]